MPKKPVYSIIWDQISPMLKEDTPGKAASAFTNVRSDGSLPMMLTF